MKIPEMTYPSSDYNLKRNLTLKLLISSDFPKLDKIVLSTSLKKGIESKEILPAAGFFLDMVSGQKAIASRARKASASFKLRQGDLIGWKTSLRNERMHQFLFKFIHKILPIEEDPSKIRNLSSFLELDDHILTSKMQIHVALQMKGQKNEKYKNLLLSGFGMPIQWLQDKAY
jgi:hypothetical protein